MLVHSHNFIKTITSWIKNISIESETVGCSVTVGGYCATETVQIDLFGSVVELKDLSYVLDGLEILVVSRVEVVERISLTRVTV